MKKDCKTEHNHVYRYWKEFPRKLQVYNDYLRRMHELSREKVASSTTSSTTTKDISLIITNILNIMPIASRKYCHRVGIDAVLHNDSSSNKVTFDSITE